ncbi:hypothetical protein AO398_00045 [Methylobacterium sp. GXS13]|uniref:AAA family ATPase n=1 Tax=Methylobacterium sp. GXS13 TaxID=1730094 RepID=UPI00071B3958|nr:AAA family ATPase [Methylobacterium sp. GXS13]KST61117.1 hypothetical protein AO398_00045 [Methylobacterium sp. GXS13]
MSDDTLGLDASILRALIYDPSSLSGPAVPTSPLSRGERLRGGEFVGCDARRELPYLLTPLLDLVLPDPVFRALRRAIDDPTLRRVRRLEAALRSELPRESEAAAREVAELLPFHQAALGCPIASARCEAGALDAATLRISAGNHGHAFLSFRAACLFASDAQSDATDIPYVGGPLRARLHEFDQKAWAWLESFRVFAAAERMIADEDAIMLGGVGVPATEPPMPLEDVMAQVKAVEILRRGDDKRAAAGPRTLVVFPRLDHLPAPSQSTRDRGDSPRALAEPWAEKGMPLTPAPDPAAFAEGLRARFPWAEEAIDAYAEDLVGAPYAAFRPRILVGPPGCGKTAFARAVLEAAGLEVTLYSCAGQMDGGSWAGTSRQWGSWRPSVPAQACLRFGKASHGIVVDEFEKAGSSRRWGRLDETILPFLERGSTARTIHDPALECALDLSAVSYIITVNSLDGIVAPMLDRAPALHWPAPRAQDMPIVAAAILAEIRRDRGLDEVWCPNLEPDEIDALTAWRGGSLRPLRRMVEAVVASRDVFARRMPN